MQPTENALQNMCKLNGWKYGSDQHTALHELFKEMWMNLSNEGDENFDNEITEDEWVGARTGARLHRHLRDDVIVLAARAVGEDLQGRLGGGTEEAEVEEERK